LIIDTLLYIHHDQLWVAQLFHKPCFRASLA